MNQTDRQATDWDEYYKKPATSAKFTRKISESKIINLISSHVKSLGEVPKIAELGGANSCFVDAILKQIKPSQYHAYDNNEYGLSLLSSKYLESTTVFTRLEDALDLTKVSERYDIVYSVGLIEHFDTMGTKKCIDSHFEICKPGGIVLITFPHPTFLYRFIRYIAETTNRWDFPDERPLSFEEVKSVMQSHGEITHESINWMIGLTQGYLIGKRNSR